MPDAARVTRRRPGYRRRLRSRIFISIALFGLVLATGFAAATVYLRSRLESQLISSTLNDNIERYADSFYTNPQLPGVPLEKLTGYVFSQRRFANVPFAWRDLDSGVHDLTEPDGKGGKLVYKLAVRKDPGYWFFLKYDTTQEQLSQTQLRYALIGAVAVFALLSLLISAWLSARVIRPVSDLARRLRNLREIGRAEPLAPHFANDEVGELAVALDEYAERLTAMVQSDREFNSDVSHELRTPLAVIASTTELLQTSPDLTDKLRERLKRIERASRQATEMIEALLLLSRAERRGPTFGETTDAGKVAADVLDSQRPQLGGRQLDLQLRLVQPLQVDAPASVLAVVLTNLVGNAVKYTQHGEVVVRVLEDRIVVEDTGPGLAEDVDLLFERGVRGKDAGGSGAGLGLAIVRRLCSLYGWNVSLRNREDRQGSVAVLRFAR
ncbi:MAG TPA: HAMP domain-containing sensor histidine kinase [Rhodanobacteraceae bacterium]|nr:HAMP domain-containing sensor histidine kinase [Rhodanobacteraceae bacterium]